MGTAGRNGCDAAQLFAANEPPNERDRMLQ